MTEQQKYVNHRYRYLLTNDIDGYNKAETDNEMREVATHYCDVIINAPTDYEISMASITDMTYPDFKFPEGYYNTHMYAELDPIEDDDETPHLWYKEFQPGIWSYIHNKDKAYVVEYDDL